VFRGFNLLYGNVNNNELSCFTNQNDPTVPASEVKLTGNKGLANGGLAPWKKVQDALYRFKLVVEYSEGNYATHILLNSKPDSL